MRPNQFATHAVLYSTLLSSTLLSGTLLSSGCFVGGGESAWEFDAAEVEAVEGSVSSGELRVEPTSGDTVRVEWDGGGVGFDKVMPEPYIHDGVLFVDADCGSACGGELLLLLPPHIDVDARVERGDLDIHLDARANIHACVAAGDLSIDVPGGAWRLDLDMGAGDLSTEGVWHDASAEHEISACVAAGDLSVVGF